MSDKSAQPLPERIPTGIPGLDAILMGGLLRKGVYMVQGRPGGGKTILANQLCFHHAAQGGQVLYSTLLAETHERLLYYVERMSYFDMSRIPAQLSYVSAFATLQQGGLKGLAEMLRREARARGATLVVLDGLMTAEEHAESNKEFKQFIQELQVHASLFGYTVLLLTSASVEPVRSEHTMVDGVIELADHRVGRMSERQIEVRKFRGSGYLRGSHAFQITGAGLTVYPRIESLYQDPSQLDSCAQERVATGVVGLDEALHGGLRCASSTVLFGPTGVGKTTLGLHFLNESSKQEPGMLFGFYESPPRIAMKARALGLDFESKLADGSLSILWFAPTERVLDALGQTLLAEVRKRGVKRLFVDGVDGFLKAAEPVERITHFLSALTNQLRVLGVTVLFTSEMTALFNERVDLPIHGISSLVENILLLRFMEQKSQLTRFLTIVKTRDSDYDNTLREFVVTPTGAGLGAAIGAHEPPAGASGLAGWPRRRLQRLLKRRGEQP